ncbi:MULTISPECIES: GntR family transcriptional regulator [Falsihalocynthiibacter]|uniref:GntR family transcriptional regulator n=1 Tax=Falsihalocynthiibacter TaxID=2854182 RepID=UPI003002446C
MDDSERQIDDGLPLTQIRPTSVPTVADQVFDALQHQILTLKLAPCTKISETDVAQKMGVSRQPVREAFKRLAKLGFLSIRPQSSTKVSLISEKAVLRARFIRTALEIHTCRTACEKSTDVGINVLSNLIEKQRAAYDAQDRELFHLLDDQFHREICNLAGVGYVWDLILENKAHMDRVRMLTLDSSSQEFVLKEHVEIFKAISESDADAAAEAITKHLSRILIHIEDIKSVNHKWFTDLA